MARPDIVIGTVDHVDPRTQIEVRVTGVDVKLTLRREDGADTFVFLGPDQAADLAGYIEQALAHDG